jgi:putative phosphoesterase
VEVVMRVGLVSDTHGDPVAWDRAISALGELDLILHAGDVLYHGIFNPITDTYEPRRLVDLLNACAVPMLHARGNCDSEVDQLALDNHILSDFAFASAEGTRILVTHGHKHSEEELAKLAVKGHIHMVHRGHTHVPGLKVINGVGIFNAGSCALPKQEGEVPTVGLLEDGRLSVFDIDTGEKYAEWELP